MIRGNTTALIVCALLTILTSCVGFYSAKLTPKMLPVTARQKQYQESRKIRGGTLVPENVLEVTEVNDVSKLQGDISPTR